MEQTLETVPTELPSAYQATVDRIMKRGPESMNLAFKVLSWILRTRRPLRMRELSESITVELDDTGREEEDIPDPTRLIEVCEGLVIHDRSSGIIRFAHYTVQEYLQEYLQEPCCRAKVVSAVHVTMSCLTYLLYDVFGSGELSEEKKREYQFLDYAARYWTDHIEELGQENNDIRKLAIRLLTMEGNYVTMLCSQGGKDRPQFYFLAEHGATTVVRWLIETTKTLVKTYQRRGTD